MKEIRAVSNRIIIKPDPEKDKVSGLMIADNAKEKPYWGLIVSHGMDVREATTGLRCYHLKNRGVPVMFNGEECLIMKEDDVLCIEGELGGLWLTEEGRKYIKETLALMNSMIKSGEDHSQTSTERFEEALKLLNKC